MLLGKNYLRIYSPKLGITTRVFLDGLDVKVEGEKVLLTPAVKAPPKPAATPGVEASGKKKKNKKGKKETATPQQTPDKNQSNLSVLVTPTPPPQTDVPSLSAVGDIPQETPSAPTPGTPAPVVQIPKVYVPLKVGLFTVINCHFTMKPNSRPLELKVTIVHEFVEVVPK